VPEFCLGALAPWPAGVQSPSIHSIDLHPTDSARERYCRYDLNHLHHDDGFWHAIADFHHYRESVHARIAPHRAGAGLSLGKAQGSSHLTEASLSPTEALLALRKPDPGRHHLASNGERKQVNNSARQSSKLSLRETLCPRRCDESRAPWIDMKGGAAC
jgi:hypothetical protein